MTAAREAHVLVQDHRLVRVRINNRREKLFYFSNLLDDEYAEAAGQASLRTVTYDYDEREGRTRRWCTPIPCNTGVLYLRFSGALQSAP